MINFKYDPKTDGPLENAIGAFLGDDMEKMTKLNAEIQEIQKNLTKAEMEYRTALSEYREKVEGQEFLRKDNHNPSMSKIKQEGGDLISKIAALSKIVTNLTEKRNSLLDKSRTISDAYEEKTSAIQKYLMKSSSSEDEQKQEKPNP